MSKALRTYERGKFRYTVLHTRTNGLYVRKAVIQNGRQKQIWRVCEPPTQERVDEILADIEAEILSGGDEKDTELAKIYLQIQSGKMSFREFKKLVEIVCKESFKLLKTLE